jgi:hypothetical protein
MSAMWVSILIPEYSSAVGDGVYADIQHTKGRISIDESITIEDFVAFW